MPYKFIKIKAKYLTQQRLSLIADLVMLLLDFGLPVKQEIHYGNLVFLRRQLGCLISVRLRDIIAQQSRYKLNPTLCAS